MGTRSVGHATTCSSQCGIPESAQCMGCGCPRKTFDVDDGGVSAHCTLPAVAGPNVRQWQQLLSQV